MDGKKYGKEDLVRENLYSIIRMAQEPLETMEIVDRFKDKKITRTKVFHRLLMLRGDNRINGKQLKAGRGIWIWWIR